MAAWVHAIIWMHFNNGYICVISCMHSTMNRDMITRMGDATSGHAPGALVCTIMRRFECTCMSEENHVTVVMSMSCLIIKDGMTSFYMETRPV
jgi:hypothetical protein